MQVKLKQKKETFMQGVMALMFSQIIVKFTGLIYKLYLTNKEGFGDKGNAIYNSGFQIYALLLTLSSIGVPNAVAKLISQKVAIGDNKEAYRIFKIALIIFSFIGFLGSIILFFGAEYISNSFINIPEAKGTLIALSPSIFFVTISSVIRGYFNGRESMKATANSHTIEQILKTIATIVLVEIISYMSINNTKYMAAAANLATTIAALFSFIYLYKYYLQEKQIIYTEVILSKKYSRERITKILKNIFTVSLPITIGALFGTLNKNIDTFTVVEKLCTFLPKSEAITQYGILSGKVDTLITFPLSINIALATALVPTISAMLAKKQKESLKKRISFSFLLTLLIGLPCAIGIYLFAEPILKLLFPKAYQGAELLKISSFSIIFIVISQTTIGILQGLGRNWVPAIALFFGTIVKLILNVILIPIPKIGILGAAISSLVCNIVSCVIELIVLKKQVNINLDIKKFLIKPLFATATMGISSYYIFLKIQTLFSIKESLIITIIIAIIVYLFLILILKIFNKEEINMIPYGQKIYKLLKR